MAEGRVHSFETFGLVDGPGVRFVAFLQGCSMRCMYCHNPETWSGKCGIRMSAKQLFDKAYRYKNYWGKDGGITISGGEALLQIDFVTEVFEIAKKNRVHTALDTSGVTFSMSAEYLEKFNRLMDVTDLVILDLKAMNSGLHKELTGHKNEQILEMARYLSDMGKPMWVRHVLVPGFTDQKSELLALRDFLHELKNIERVEILPYHTLGRSKWEKLGMEYPLEGVRTPSDEEVAKAERILGLKTDLTKRSSSKSSHGARIA